MRRIRLLVLLAGFLAFLGMSLLLVHAANVALVARAARRADGGGRPGEAERFERYVAFAHRDLRDPGYDALPGPAVRLYYRLNPMHPGAGDVLRWGADYRGPCGSYSNVVIEMLRMRRMRARPLLLLDPGGHSIHTVVECLVEGRWVVGDPVFGIVYRDRAGRPATAAELAADPALVRDAVRGVPGYPPEYDYRAVALFNWHKVPVVLPAVRAVLVFLVGEARVREVARPTLWMRPELTYGCASLLLAAAPALLAWRARRRLRVVARREAFADAGEPGAEPRHLRSATSR